VCPPLPSRGAITNHGFHNPADWGIIPGKFYSRPLLSDPNTTHQRLAIFLDRPGFPWKRLILGFSIGQYVFESFLSLRQYRVLCETRPPKTLENEIDQETFDKSQAYGRAKSKFSFVSNLYSQVQNILFIQYDILPKLWALTGGWLARYAPERFGGEISHSIVFLFTFTLISQLLALPLSYYGTFVLEEKFGFNKQTVKLWVTDMLKSQALMIGLGTPLLAAFLKIIQLTGELFFAYVFVFMLAVQVFGITIYPIFILPLFNKLSPLEEGPLKSGVEALAKRLEFPLHELYVIDGSKRSAHSNAYFYGLPWKKHIVIYDTLIQKSETEEVVAVLGHELGHWKMGHTTKIFGIAQVHLVVPHPQDFPTNNLLVPHLLHLRPLQRLHQQRLALRLLRVPQHSPHNHRLHSFL
jgi:STE24 endopeptidase